MCVHFVCALCVFRTTIVQKVLKRKFAAKVNRETLNRGLMGFPNLQTAKQAILDILLTANKYNIENHEEMGGNIKTCQLYEQKLPECAIGY